MSFSVTGFRITQKAVLSLFTLLAGKLCPSAIQSNGHPMSVYRSMIFKHFSRYTHCSLPMSSSFFGMHRLNHLFWTWILFSLCHQNFVCKCNFVWRTGKQKKEQRAEKYLFVIYLLFTSGRYKMTLFLTNA